MRFLLCEEFVERLISGPTMAAARPVSTQEAPARPYEASQLTLHMFSYQQSWYTRATSGNPFEDRHVPHQLIPRPFGVQRAQILSILASYSIQVSISVVGHLLARTWSDAHGV